MTVSVVWGAPHLGDECEYTPVRRLALFIEQSFFKGKDRLSCTENKIRKARLREGVNGLRESFSETLLTNFGASGHRDVCKVAAHGFLWWM
jgi:hypothetical protein